MHPNKKDIANIYQPYKWLKLLHFEKICLSFIHINTGVWRSKRSSNSSTRDLLHNFLLKSKKLFLRLNSADLTRSWVGIFEEVCSSNLFLMLKIRSLCGMLGYRLTTSAATKKEPSGTFPILFILSLKFPVSRFALKALNENQETLMLSLLEFHSWRLQVFQVHYEAAYEF